MILLMVIIVDGYMNVVVYVEGHGGHCVSYRVMIPPHIFLIFFQIEAMLTNTLVPTVIISR